MHAYECDFLLVQVQTSLEAVLYCFSCLVEAIIYHVRGRFVRYGHIIERRHLRIGNHFRAG